MKKYLWLSMVGLLTAALLGFFYFRGEQRLTAQHEEILKLLASARQAETLIEKDLLRSRTFMLLNYDTLANGEAEISEICPHLRNPLNELYRPHAQHLATVIDGYCAALDEKIEDIERFKSKNAIFRNSLYYLHAMATDPMFIQQSSSLRQILTRALAYAYFYSAEDQSRFQQLIQSHSLSSQNPQVQLTLAHAEKILQLKGELDTLTNQVINSPSQAKLDDLRQIYQHAYFTTEKTAKNYRKMLLFSSALLIILIIYIQIGLWRSAKALADVNQNLEERVESRTQQLQGMNDTILQQQALLVSSTKLSALGEMAGQVAHEINTPLGAIVLTAQGLMRKAQEPDVALVKEDVVAKMDLILRITTKLSRIINSMRQLAGHGAKENFSDVVIKTMVDDTLLLCAGRLTKASIVFELDNQVPEEMRLQCRANEISQVLVNLLNNAHDAVKENADKWVKLKIQQNANQVVFTLMDSGLGISKENLTKIFTPSFTTKSLDNGTGFGLSICKKIIERHGGRIFIDSSQMNTTFVFQLPLEQTEALAKAANG